MSAAAPWSLSIAEAGAALRRGDLTSVALTEAALSQVALWEDSVHAFITPTPDLALNRARAADADFVAGIDRGPLQGIPYGVKDIYDTAGIRTTCGSFLQKDRVPDTDSFVSARMAQGGGVLLGKLNTYEFAIGDRTDHVPFPPANNPWNLSRVTPGSSSGSGVGIATGMMRIATGSDTGGSIRLPAACCGVVGLKPTFGRLSRSGVYPFSPSCDHTGLLTGDVTDMALGMRVITAYDPADPDCADVPVPDFSAGLDQGVAGLRIGIDPAFVEYLPIAPAMQAEFARIRALLTDLGAELVEVTMPPQAHFAACAGNIIGIEGLASHYHHLRADSGPDTRTLRQSFLPAIGVTALDYIQAQKLRREVTEQVSRVLRGVDVILTVTTSGGAVPYDPKPVMTEFGRTTAFNITGHPALSLPTGLDDEGLPLSVQLAGRHFDEPMVLRVARALERVCGWNARRPAFPPAGDAA